ncbi:glycoside hydrolase superfamily [Coniella lustricola]|uniref:Beta-xylanase n=1 Tax=Coniella lustricola TaxID=2025994 RepID=A0A2T3AHB7_9PEZI|nr:glycoside hydrolase superfamily [Coniella lustricola]
MNGDVLDDKVMNPIASKVGDFGQYTCEYQMTFAWTESKKNDFTYDLADAVVDQANKYGMIMRCHSLVWHQSLPSWVTSAKWTNATLLAVMKNHITNVVKHFQGKCYAWDVVNEALYTDGSYRGSYQSSTEESSLWYETIGEAYIPIAFATASAADPSAKLYYNDYDIEVPDTQGDKIQGVHNLVAMLSEYQAPIHGIGLEGHFNASKMPSVEDLISGLQNFSSLGLEVAYTELDVQSPTSDPDRTGEAMGYANAVTACLRSANCVGWTVWGFTEKYSWLTNCDPSAEGDLWDDDGIQNLAYDYALTSLPTCWGWRCFNGNTTTVSTTSSTSAIVSVTATGVTNSSGVGLGLSVANGSFVVAVGLNSSRTDLGLSA